LPDTNYDYDSEAEWEEPEEGEDLNSEDEEEMSEDGDDDMDGFLDDEDDAMAGGKRRLIVGDLEPVSSGIRWASDGVDPDLKVYQIETISDAVKFPIDPFSTAYWEKPRAETAAPKGRVAATGLEAFGVKPTSNPPAVSSALPLPTSKAKKPFPPESLGEFKQAVDGSDLSKIGLVEILKKRSVSGRPATFSYYCTC
jgi:chromatin assembly factor 1 subunit A